MGVVDKTTRKKLKSGSNGPWLSWTRTLSCKSDARDVVVNLPQQQRYKIRSSTSSSSAYNVCNCSTLKDVIHGNTRVVHRAPSSGSPTRSTTKDESLSADYLQEVSQEALFLEESHEAPLRGAPQHRKKFGSSCNGCNVAVDTVLSFKDSSIRSCANFPQLACAKCGDCFTRVDALEHHHALQHAVSELPRGDSSRNIIEIIFRSSWTTSHAVCGRIERVLKVHNSQRTLSKFEDYRDAVKSIAMYPPIASSNSSTTSSIPLLRAKSTSNNQARCIADGNELLRFYGTTLACPLGSHGSSSLCNLPSCGICRIARSGFSARTKGAPIRTTATSSNAHWQAMMIQQQQQQQQQQDHHHHNHQHLRYQHPDGDGMRRAAMVVCRVIAGRSYRCSNTSTVDLLPSGFDSVEVCSEGGDAEDLLVFNAKAVLPCFVVIFAFGASNLESVVWHHFFFH